MLPLPIRIRIRIRYCFFFLRKIRYCFWDPYRVFFQRRDPYRWWQTAGAHGLPEASADTWATEVCSSRPVRGPGPPNLLSVRGRQGKARRAFWRMRNHLQRSSSCCFLFLFVYFPALRSFSSFPQKISFSFFSKKKIFFFQVVDQIGGEMLNEFSTRTTWFTFREAEREIKETWSI